MSHDIILDLDKEVKSRRGTLKKQESFFKKSITILVKYDKDNDNKLSFNEYVAFCKDNNHGFSYIEFKLYDKNKSEYLEPIEFINLYYCLLSADDFYK